MKRILAFILSVFLILGLSACGTNTVKGSIVECTDEGMAVLDIMPQKLFEITQLGDTVVVSADGFMLEMPIIDALIAEDGMPQLYYSPDSHSLALCVYNQSFCELYNIAIGSKVRIHEK